MNYTLPPWLNPSAALGYGELAGAASRAALTAQVERDRMNQEAAMKSVEMQQRSQQVAAENQANKEQLDYQHQMEQQKIAIEQAYHQQEIGLKQQDQDLAERQFQAQTQKAAQSYIGLQKFQQAILPKDQGGEGLSHQEAALKYLAQGMTADAAGRVALTPQPFVPKVVSLPGPNGTTIDTLQTSPNSVSRIPSPPQSVTNAPTAIPMTDAEGNVTANAYQFPGQKPVIIRKQSDGNSADAILKKRLDERQGKATAPGKLSTAVDSGKSGKGEVIRIVNGKRAVFDSSTKQFIRWADKEPANAD
jgi:hypothetical protein